VNEIFRVEKILEDLPDVLLLTSCGNLDSDILNIRKVRVAAPGVRIVMFGGVGAEREFLQYVRAGIRGYLLLGASIKDVWETLEAVHAGKACCPSSLCGLLFNYFEREATSLPSGAVRQQLGLTRREQQLIPLIAQGLTNKEIANRFCLSEQTVKNHLYRMKHKVGADNRLGIVQTCHTQGFLL
jgi:DNA-binding NarL/FixJ family response regulator